MKTPFFYVSKIRAIYLILLGCLIGCSGLNAITNQNPPSPTNIITPVNTNPTRITPSSTSPELPSATPTQVRTSTPIKVLSTTSPLATFTPTSTSKPVSQGWIAFNTAHGPNTDELDIIKSDGTGLKLISSQLEYGTRYGRSSWSPDGIWVTFEAAIPYGPGEYSSQLFKVQVDGTGLQQLTFGQGNSYDPAWSPKGDKIVYDYFMTGKDGLVNPTDLYLINIDGTSRKALTSTPEVSEGCPVWSPDGEKIAYLSNFKSQQYAYLYIMDADGSNQKKMSVFQVDCRIAWSPDGKQIALRSHQDCGLYVFNLDNGSIKLLDRSMNIISPTWSPDGNQIAFLGSNWDCTGSGYPTAAGWQIFVIGSDGQGMVQITSNPEIYPFDIAWSPVPALHNGEKYQITELGSNLNLRELPSLNGKIIEKLQQGETIEIIDGPTQADGYYWWNIRASGGSMGWVVEVAGWYHKIDQP